MANIVKEIRGISFACLNYGLLKEEYYYNSKLPKVVEDLVNNSSVPFSAELSQRIIKLGD